MITRKGEMSVEVREHMRGGAGSALLTPISSALPGNMRLFSTITLKKGCGIGFHEHNNETELFYFISGKGRVQDDDKFFDVGPGDCLSTPNGHGHSVENTGEDDLVFVAAIVLD